MHLRFVHVRPLAGFFLCNKLMIEASNTYITVCNERMLSNSPKKKKRKNVKYKSGGLSS